MIQLVKIIPSHLATKKYDAHFITDVGRTKVVPFGARGMEDYTIHKDIERQKRYLVRHRSREDWTNPMTPGALSRYVLWSATTLKQGINNYKQQFNL